MRSLLILAALLAAAVAARAADVEFVRVWPEWRNAQSFERISEYFTGKENTGAQTVRRTHPEARAGFYFMARIRNRGPELPSAKLVLSLIKPDNPHVRVYTFPVPVPAGEHVFSVGLTGADWPGEKTQPVAWKLEVVATDGTTLGAYKSFLWEKPPK